MKKWQRTDATSVSVLRGQAGRMPKRSFRPPPMRKTIAMAELGAEKLTELVDLTTRLTESMEKQFSRIEGNL